MEEAAASAEVVEAGDIGIIIAKARIHLLMEADRRVHDVAGFKDAATGLLMDWLPIRALDTDGVELGRHCLLDVHATSAGHPLLDFGLATGRGQRIHEVFSATSGDEHGDFLDPEPWGIPIHHHRQSRAVVQGVSGS